MIRVLDEGLDELAARSHQGFVLRMAMTFGVALLVSTMLAWQVCLTWVTVQTCSETVSWFISRDAYRGLKASLAKRAAFLATLSSGCTIWMVLGGLLWASGTPEGAVAAAILWLSIIFFTQTNAYQSPTGFVIGGAIPGICMLAWVISGPNPLHLPMIPTAGLFVLALTFAADGVFRALTARRKFNEAQTQLAASEAQYRVLADNLTDVISLTDINGKRIYVSPSVSTALGYSIQEWYEGAIHSRLHPEDALWLPGKLAAFVEHGGEMTQQYRVIHKDGNPVWVETNFGLVTPLVAGEALQILSVSRPIDARKTLENELVEARKRAEEAAAAKSEFLANMTHELRTPLNAIIGFSGILKRSQRLQPQDARHVDLIHGASDALLELVNSVLDFSKLEACAVELEAQPFDPAESANAIVTLLSDQAEAKGLFLDLSSQGDIRPLVGDPARIRQVVLNFLSNALKFTQAGGISVVVRQGSASEGQDRLRIEVTDTGIGVAQAQVDHLFDRFTQADASVSREYGGTGLGLAICKRTLDLMGGTIGAQSTPGQGSTFWFELLLPRFEGSLEITHDRPAPTPERPLRLLVVEDVAVNRELILTLLGPFDIEIDVAENGAMGVEAMRTGDYDLVLMDVQMPVMDGLTATRAIRALPNLSAQSTPIIAMTANVLPGQVAKCLEAGMDDHLGKPISPSDLLNIISRWSDGREVGGRRVPVAA